MHDPAGSEIFAGGGGLEARAEPDQTIKGTIRIKPRDSRRWTLLRMRHDEQKSLYEPQSDPPAAQGHV
jgi:hypothetical protein